MTEVVRQLEKALLRNGLFLNIVFESVRHDPNGASGRGAAGTTSSSRSTQAMHAAAITSNLPNVNFNVNFNFIRLPNIFHPCQNRIETSSRNEKQTFAKRCTRYGAASYIANLRCNQHTKRSYQTRNHHFPLDPSNVPLNSLKLPVNEANGLQGQTLRGFLEEPQALGGGGFLLRTEQRRQGGGGTARVRQHGRTTQKPQKRDKHVYVQTRNDEAVLSATPAGHMGLL